MQNSKCLTGNYEHVCIRLKGWQSIRKIISSIFFFKIISEKIKEERRGPRGWKAGFLFTMMENRGTLFSSSFSWLKYKKDNPSLYELKPSLITCRFFQFTSTPEIFEKVLILLAQTKRLFCGKPSGVIIRLCIFAFVPLLLVPVQMHLSL